VIRGGFVRIGVNVFRRLGGFGNFVFEKHMFTNNMVFRGV
jgi:hypothetical protein